MSLDTFQPGGLYVTLKIRNDPPVENDFHWGLYLHENSRVGGTHHDIKGSRESGWIAHHERTTAVLKWLFLVGLVQVATVPDESVGDVDRILRSLDTTLMDYPDISCRVWVLDMLKKLQEQLGNVGILRGVDVDGKMQSEILAWGNQNALAAARNEQPRPVAVSESALRSH
ncbi:hypothetical protein K474DRAFT_1686450 [Panus rudis PR-1116 ss-1]|nr:hypothetical protein K474DRAFT_1686450 [Panus rudis PR-1116 ss-1]